MQEDYLKKLGVTPEQYQQQKALQEQKARQQSATNGNTGTTSTANTSQVSSQSSYVQSNQVGGGHARSGSGYKAVAPSKNEEEKVGTNDRK
mmetsp:Transcript_21560/g.18586  ORF Transcript_21560/g.18586 Transcript_21560/m.18586 type:complete len:91 (+) Transcript_21560:1139-1411(+)